MSDLSKDVSSKPVSYACMSCRELKGTVDRFSTYNQSPINELNGLKESIFFIKKKESQYLKKIKSCKAEVKTLTEKLNKELQVIDLAHETMRDKTKELSDKCKELSNAQVKIFELQRKVDQFRNTSFVMNHMMGNLKKEY
ncbi:hypothetical protein Hanom_Chr06g00493381 [Helianthus anomalus]